MVFCVCFYLDPSDYYCADKNCGEKGYDLILGWITAGEIYNGDHICLNEPADGDEGIQPEWIIFMSGVF